MIPSKVLIVEIKGYIGNDTSLVIEPNNKMYRPTYIEDLIFKIVMYFFGILFLGFIIYRLINLLLLINAINLLIK